MPVFKILNMYGALIRIRKFRQFLQKLKRCKIFTKLKLRQANGKICLSDQNRKENNNNHNDDNNKIIISKYLNDSLNVLSSNVLLSVCNVWTHCVIELKKKNNNNLIVA